ncbi:MAG: hypothetical protein JNN07_11750 [Verrucomicrobiales bacterium]|nr:hypothetical protein [Verrucomicrobiales bacterium]
MHINTLADRLRSTLPKPLWECLRKASNAVLGPLHFSLETGHLRSCLASKAMTRQGEPIPWFTYSAIQFLMMKNLSSKTLLEWGAGQSTFFWGKRCKSVTSFEADSDWFRKLQPLVPSNVELHLVKNDISDVDHLLGTRKFDLVVCDGLDRYKCAERSLQLLNANGAVIIDNSDGNQGPKPGFGFIDLYRTEGYSRIDFYGYPPGNTVQQSTSIFFKGDCFLFAGEEAPWAPLSYWEYSPEIQASWQTPSV